MIGKHLMIGAAALHLALASAVPTQATRAQDAGQGIWDTLACTTCAVVGGVAAWNGALLIASATILAGGPQAVGLVSAGVACVHSCVNMVSSFFD